MKKLPKKVHYILIHRCLRGFVSFIRWGRGITAAVWLGLLLSAWAEPGSADGGYPVAGRWRSRCGFGLGAAVPEDESAPAAPLEFTVEAGRKNEFFVPVKPGAWADAGTVEWRFTFSPDWPEGVKICFFTKDRDHLWRQYCLPWKGNAEGTAVFRLPLRGEEAVRRWQASSHRRPWHVLTSAHLREAGFRITFPPATGDFRAHLELSELNLFKRSEEPAPPVVTNVELMPPRPRVGEMVEVRLLVEGAYSNPFDRSDIAVDMEVVRPDNRTEQVAGFYYEGFVAVPGRPRSRLLPCGRPEFRVRYTPRTAGEHRLRLIVSSGEGGITQVPVFSFSALPPGADYHGYVRVDPDYPLALSYDSGRVFTGIGLNIRTPDDLRYLQMNPASTWRDEGLEIYRRLLPELAAAGVNVIEVWMASWWLALEWINDAPGFHGVGYYNPYRAWKLDQLLRLAEDHGIYLILVLNNHGKFSTFCDQEWDRNPYNLDNGGFLSSPDHYFSDEQARAAFKRTADYLVARWGYSPNLLMWKLFSEINLTGTSSRVYRQPPMRRWHREMAAYLKEIDPYQHLVTTHWSSNYTVINDSIAGLEQIDVLSTDAYSDSTAQVVAFFKGTGQYAAGMGKPTIITEYGGPPRGDTIGTLKKQLRLGLWEGYFLDAAVIPMLWWFGFVHENNRYNEFASLAAFQQGEDRRGMEVEELSFAEARIQVRLLRGSDRVLIWGYDQDYYFSRHENRLPRAVEGLTLVLNEMRAGRYRLEHWRGEAEAPVAVTEVLVGDDGGKAEIAVPDFTRDFTMKLIKDMDP